MGSPLKIAIYNLGCRVNAYESFALADIARARGFEVVPWGEKADFAVVNSCALTVLAQAKTRQAFVEYLFFTEQALEMPKNPRPQPESFPYPIAVLSTTG